MALREYTDASGAVWQVWHVVPTTRTVTPAIAAERRRHAEADFPEDRRRRFTLTPGMEGGWLCFESAAEKRRLAPVPADWDSCGDDALGRYLASAGPVSRRIVEGATSPRFEATLPAPHAG